MEGDERRSWTLLTSHGHVLVEIARNPQVRVRDISAAIGITERATQSIIADLERAGYVERVRVGRRTHYVLHADNPFRHAAQEGLVVGPFLQLLTGATDPRTWSGATEPEPEPEAMEGLVAAAAMEAEAASVATLDTSVTPVTPVTPVAATESSGSPAPAVAAQPDGIAPTPGGPDLPSPGLN